MAAAAMKITDREYLESRGWKLIGTKKTKFGG